jgi:two-component system, cell cycle response regulator
LTFFFVAIVVIPLLVAGFLVRAAITREVERRTDIKLRGEAQALGAAWQGQARLVALQTHLAAMDVAGALSGGRSDRRASSGVDVEALRVAIASLRATHQLDYLVVQVGPTLVSSVATPDLLPGSPAIQGQDLLEPGPMAPLLVPATVPIEQDGTQVAVVHAGDFLDQSLARELSRVAGGVPFEVVIAGHVAVSDAATRIVPGGFQPTGARTHPAPTQVRVTKDLRAMYTRIGGAPPSQVPEGIAVVADIQANVSDLRNAILLVLFGSVLVATLLGFGLARLVAEPLRRLASQASAVLAESPGLAADPAAQGADEVATVATTLSAMSEHLQQYATELERSRAELRQTLERLGSTLRSTHDLHGVLSVALDSAAVALGARSGAVYLLDPTGTELFAEVSRGIESPSIRLRAGQGMAGAAVATRSSLRCPTPGGPTPHPAEPSVETALAVPLTRGDRTIGAIALYGREHGRSFSEEDLDSLHAFAKETGVAVENVMQHERAERLSMTDALTGTGNRRSLEAALSKEIERARRYGRTLSVLMVDIDRFKQVNDLFGHLRGDDVLVAVSRLIEESVRRDVDSVTRYGGEEFVVVLPETDPDGARAAGERIRVRVAAARFPVEVPSDAAASPDAASARTQGGRDARYDRGARTFGVTLSVGHASFPDNGSSSDELIQAADRGMYVAKGRGGDGVAAQRSRVGAR